MFLSDAFAKVELTSPEAASVLMKLANDFRDSSPDLYASFLRASQEVGATPAPEEASKPSTRQHNG